MELYKIGTENGVKVYKKTYIGNNDNYDNLSLSE